MKKATQSQRSSKDGCNSVGNFSSRFKLQSFVRRVDKLTDNQKNTIRTMGFGSLLQIPHQTLSINLLTELMERWSCEKIAFLLASGAIPITLMDVAVILGLRVIGDPVILREKEPFSNLEEDYGAAIWNRKINIVEVEERLDSLGETDNDDFIRTFLLFTFGTVLFPNPNLKVDSRYLSILQDLEKVCNFAWGAAVLEDMIGWLCKRKNEKVQYVGGCLIFLQIWSYEHIDIARPSLVDRPLTFPRACRWENSRSNQRQWYTTKFKELGKNQITGKLQLTAEEAKLDTVKELLEAQSDDKELPEQGYNILVDKDDNLRTRLLIMDEWIAEMANESDMGIVRKTHGVQKYRPKQTRIARNERVMPIVNVDISPTALPVSSHQSSPIIIISDDDDGDNSGFLRDQNSVDENTKWKEEIDELMKENRLLKARLLSSSALEEQNAILRNKVENLRRENQLLILSSKRYSLLVSRLEKACDEKVNATEEQSSALPSNGSVDRSMTLPVLSETNFEGQLDVA